MIDLKQHLAIKHLNKNDFKVEVSNSLIGEMAYEFYKYKREVGDYKLTLLPTFEDMFTAERLKKLFELEHNYTAKVYYSEGYGPERHKLEIILTRI